MENVCVLIGSAVASVSMRVDQNEGAVLLSRYQVEHLMRRTLIE